MNLSNDFTEEEVSSTASTEKNLIHEFIVHLPEDDPKKKTHYENVLVDFFLFYGKEWNELSVDHSEGYLNYLKRVNAYKKFSKSVLNQKVRMINSFLKFLFNSNVISRDPMLPFEEYFRTKKNRHRPTHLKTSRITNQPNKLPEVIMKFLLFLQDNDYSNGSKYRKQIMPFFKFIENRGENMNVFLEENKEEFLMDHIRKYETFLSSRVSKEEITLASATTYLRAVQLFVKFLSSKGLVSRRYSIPLQLRGRGKRADEYVPKERMIELMNAIYENSNQDLRDLSIFLIILDTGCRPIEVSNLTLQDVDKVERTLSFECRKTERRKVKISKEVMEVIMDYLDSRNQYRPCTDFLFVNCMGNPITPSVINMIFYTANITAFGESLYPAKAFRHSYITNALEEHSFERVSNSIGHKDWKSTNYYLSRSKKRLLSNTLGKSPLYEMR